MIPHISCESIFHFARPTTLYDRFFGFTSIIPIFSKSPASLLRRAFSSFDPNIILSPQPVSEREIISVQVPTYITPNTPIYNYYKDNHDSFIIKSLYDDFRFYFLTSAALRFCELLALSAQQQVNRSNWQPGTKIITNTLLFILPYTLFSFLGYNSIQLLLSKLSLFLIHFILSLKLSNFIREIDFLSSYKSLYLIDFLSKNSFTLIKNTFSILFIYFGISVFFDLKLWSKHQISLHNEIVPPIQSHASDGAGIAACGENYSITALLSDPTSYHLGFFSTEIAFLLGKITLDLALALILKLALASKADLRDPFRSLFPKSWLQKMGVNYSQIELQELQAQQSHLQENLKRIRTKEKDLRNQINTHTHFFSQFPSQPQPANIPPAPSTTVIPPHNPNENPHNLPHQKIKTKKSTQKKQTHPSPSTSQASTSHPYTLNLTLNEQTLTFFPLSGKSIHTQLWGAVSPEDLSPQELSAFQKCLSSGLVEHRKPISPTKQNGILKLRPHGKLGKLRLHGKIQDLLPFLQSHFPLEQAHSLYDRFNPQNAPKPIQIILFKDKVKKIKT